jgi:hypothetical protein
MMRTAAALLLLAALFDAASAHGDTHLMPGGKSDAPRVEVRGARIRATDILGSSAADVDLGATPPIGATRLLDKAEIERAFAGANATPPKKIPAQVRVSRKTKKLSAAEVGGAIRTALAATKLPRGASLSSVRANAAEVPADFQKVSVELPTIPRKAGPITVQATVSFLGDEGAVVQKTLTPIALVLPPEAAFAEIAKGAPIALVVRRGLVEVTTPGVAAADADIGAILPVTIKPSGRVLRARAIDKDHAVALEDN